MNKKYILFLLFSIPLIVYGQHHTKEETIYYNKLNNQFSDSLKIKKLRILHNSKDDKSLLQMLIPMFFDKNITTNLLKINKNKNINYNFQNAINKAFMNVYLSKPSAIKKFDEDNKSIIEEPIIEEPIKHDLLLSNNIEDVLPEETKNVNILVKRPDFWVYKGDYFLQFLQNYISDNWHKGGESNYSMLARITMEANYNNKQKLKWENKLELYLGFLTSKSDSLHSLKTSEDLIRYTGKLGVQASKRWYYTLQVLAYTQFTQGYKSNDPFVYSDFMSPFNLNISLGMNYSVEALKGKLKGNVHIAPFAYNFRFVDRSSLTASYGLKEGRHTLHDIGSQFTADLNWAFTDNISWKTRLYAFTTYHRCELEWENTFMFKFNKYISSTLFIHPRFDDDVPRNNKHNYWQFKEFVSLGFAYSF